MINKLILTYALTTIFFTYLGFANERKIIYGENSVTKNSLFSNEEDGELDIDLFTEEFNKSSDSIDRSLENLSKNQDEMIQIHKEIKAIIERMGQYNPNSSDSTSSPISTKENVIQIININTVNQFSQRPFSQYDEKSKEPFKEKRKCCSFFN